MKKRQKIRLKVVFVIIVVIIVASLMYSCEKTYDIHKVPSSVSWSKDVKDQVETIRQSENDNKAKENMEANSFPLKVLNEIPKKASELNLSWADNRELNPILFLFIIKDKMTLLDESLNNKFKVNLNGYEPGFVIKLNNYYQYYFLESFNKVLNIEDLKLLFVEDYINIKEQDKKLDEVIKSVDFSSSVYPCSVYDNIHYWIKFAKENNIKLLGHGEYPDSNWKNILYGDAQYYLDNDFIIALNLPDDSRYIKMQSAKEFIETPEKKMAVNLP